jgi:hypothetical protein
VPDLSSENPYGVRVLSQSGDGATLKTWRVKPCREGIETPTWRKGSRPMVSAIALVRWYDSPLGMRRARVRFPPGARRALGVIGSTLGFQPRGDRSFLSTRTFSAACSMSRGRWSLSTHNSVSGVVLSHPTLRHVTCATKGACRSASPKSVRVAFGAP